MSDDLPGNRPPKSRSDAPTSAADAQELLLPGSLKAELLRQLSPTRSERERVQAGIAAALGGATPASPTVEQADASMAVRAGQLKAGTVLGGTLTTKVVVSSLLLASVVALTTVSLRRTEEPRVASAPIASPNASPPEPPSVAERAAQPSAARVAKIEPEVSSPSRASNFAPATAKPATMTSPERSRRMRTLASPLAAPERNASDSSAPAVVSREVAKVVTPAAKPPPTAAKPALALAGELELVRGASDAVDRQDPKAALALLARYQQKYPSGSLSIEVQALRAIALCLDEQPQAAAARDAFLHEHGSSALAGRVRSGCR